jgi:hypothetical protein
MEINFLSQYDYFVRDTLVKDLQRQRYCIFDDLEGTGINFENE